MRSWIIAPPLSKAFHPLSEVLELDLVRANVARVAVACPVPEVS
jgi:hypothetical protein